MRERFIIGEENGIMKKMESIIFITITYSSHYFFQLHWIKVVKKPLNAKALLNVHPSSGIM